MSSLHEQLRKYRWKSLEHAYGSATDTPGRLLKLLSEDAEEREQTLEQLWASICHQGSVYTASAAAATCLIEILQVVPDEQKPDILDLLDGLAVRHWYAERDLVTLRMGGFDEGRQSWQSLGQFLQEGNNYHRPEWMERSHHAVGEGIPVYLSLLQSTHEKVVRKTLWLLSGYRELSETIVPDLMKFVLEATDPTLKAIALRCLGCLLDAQAPEWDEYRRLIADSSDEVHISVRFAAAETFAKYHPAETTQEMINILIGNMLLSPYSLDLQVLSSLGMPTGLQALMTLFERGSSSWHLLDTMRVAEAVLDMAFFGGWVEGRYWHYRTSSGFASTFAKVNEIMGIAPPDPTEESEDIPDLREGAACFRFHYGMHSSNPPRPDDKLIEVWRYDQVEAERLKQIHEQEGLQALSDQQKEAIQTVLRCKPLWQYRHNLMEIYGLPIKHRELVAFLLMDEPPGK